MAPTRAQASIKTGSSGTMGRYRTTLTVTGPGGSYSIQNQDGDANEIIVTKATKGGGNGGKGGGKPPK